ncbi:hypothetical protein [Tabrizicola soli]|uniref:DUF4747 family protein n=1 Tax=Tabrizicola soli TaxID=2185115 RepID=A0ABV7DNH9_9RHOB|nr:hypothetical protein [Tabrizicola soli]
MKNNERHIYFYDLRIKKAAKHAHIPHLRDLLSVWNGAFAVGQAKHTLEKGSVVYRIGDVKYDAADETVELLIRRSDLSAAEAAYGNIDTGNLRIAKKTPDEGGDVAAHVVMSLKQEKGKPDTYLTLVEGVPRIGHLVIQSTLNRVIREKCRTDKTVFQYADPGGARKDGSPKMNSFVPTVELQGHLSEDFVSDLENGVVGGIELLKHKTKTPLGGSAYIREEAQILKLSVDKSLPAGGRWSNILKPLQRMKIDYPTAKIRFIDPDKKARTVEIDVDTGTPTQQLYVKCYRVTGINPPLAQSSASLVRHLADMMNTKLKSVRDV